MSPEPAPPGADAPEPPPSPAPFQATPSRCPACLRPVKPGAKFCTACGRDFSVRRATGPRSPVKNPVDADWRSIRGLVIGIVFVMVISFGVAGIWEPEWQALLIADAVMAVLVIAWSLMRSRDIRPLLSCLGMPVWLLPVIAGGGLVTWWLATVLMVPFERLMPEGVAEADIREMFPSAVLAVISICVAPAILEELMFRGIIQSRLSRLTGPKAALVASSAIFAIAHLNPLGFWGYLLPLGLYLGWLRMRTGSIYPSMIAHFAHNGVVLLVAYMGG